MKQYKCKHCGHKWYPRSPKRPGMCPKCRATNWDKAPQVKFRKKDKGIVRIGGWTFVDDEEE